MKKSNLWLMALLVVGIGMNFASCKEDELTEEEKEQQAAQELTEALEWWNVVSQLTDVQELPDNWKKATFEPAVGKALESDPYTRVVSTGDLATAAQRFAYLTGAGVDESTSSYTWSNKDAGSLTYHAGSPSGTYLAQVDVNLKQMPKLKKILYQTPDQMGDNASGSFTGTAYYRFGDVVKKLNADGNYDYWICVRPAFSLEGKGDSHWVSISQLPTTNIYAYTSGDITWKVPTKLGESKEHMQNFAEMLYALLEPQQYYANLADLKLKTFHDFGRTKFNTYHSQLFWQRVSNAWSREKLISKIFLTSPDKFKEMLSDEGLTLLYKGYSWKWGWTCSLWQASYTNVAKNLHTATYTTPSANMKSIVFDATMFSDNKSYYSSFFGDNKTRFIVRYAKGEELCKDAKGKGSYDVKQKLSSCEDVYVYNKYWYPVPFDLGSDPETADDIAHSALGVGDETVEAKSLSKVDKLDRGKFIGQDGMIYKTREDAVKAGTTPVALVIDTYNEDFEALKGSNAPDKTHKELETMHGLIMKGIGIALEDSKNVEGPISGRHPAEITKVADWDPKWEKAHHVTNNAGLWLVPNAYHWQRMLLPYRSATIMLQSYLYENLKDISDQYMQDINFSNGLVKQLQEADAALTDDYMVAGGTYRKYEDIGLEQPTYAIIASDTNLQWGTSMWGQKNRYVLVW